MHAAQFEHDEKMQQRWMEHGAKLEQYRQVEREEELEGRRRAADEAIEERRLKSTQ